MILKCLNVFVEISFDIETCSLQPENSYLEHYGQMENPSKCLLFTESREHVLEMGTISK